MVKRELPMAKKPKRVFEEITFDFEHPHWAVCDLSDPPASGYTEAVIMKSTLTPSQQAILEEIEEEFSPIAKTAVSENNTPSSSDETGDDNKVLKGKQTEMTDFAKSPEFLALQEALKSQQALVEALSKEKEALELDKKVSAIAVELDSLKVEKSSELASVLVKLEEADKEVVLKSLKAVQEAADKVVAEKVEELSKSTSQAAEVSAALVADLSVEKGHSDAQEQKEITEIEKSLQGAVEILKNQYNKKGAK